MALGTDLDGNYRPVLTSYDQLGELAALLRDRGLASDRVHQILGGNALRLLSGILPSSPADGSSGGLTGDAVRVALGELQHVDDDHDRHD